MRRRADLALRLALLLSALLTASVARLPAPASANGSTIRVALSYLPGVSNWGPDNATGMVELVRAEGDVRLSVLGLPRLTDGLYQLWLVDLKSGTQYSLGKFNVTANGQGDLETVADIQNVQFDLVVISVEPEPDPSSNADSRLSIAGRYAAPVATPGARPTSPTGDLTSTPGVVGTPIQGVGTPTAGTGTPASGSPTPAPTPTVPLPTQLPRTGEPGADALAAAALCISFVIFVGLRRVGSPR
jgi:hypothetical protein